VWEAVSGHCVKTFNLEQHVNRIVTTPVQKDIVLVAASKYIKIIDLNCQEPIQSYQDAHEENVTSLGITRVTNMLYSAGEDKKIK
ncbi:hypothetical protein KIPB_016698, partial [Kipferlia bialata]